MLSYFMGTTQYKEPIMVLISDGNSEIGAREKRISVI